MHFEYSSQNGIIRHFHDVYGDSYSKYFILNESSYVRDQKIDKAFDINSSRYSYWIPSTMDGYFSICFPFHSISIESFEIITSDGYCFPVKFGVEVSFDGKLYYNYKEFEPNMKYKEIKQFLYNVENVRCFKHKSIKSTCESHNYGGDIINYEFFGTLYSIKNVCTQALRANFRSNFFDIIILIFLN